MLNHGKYGAGGGDVSRPESTPGVEVLVHPVDVFR
jgi:hypothetical protein